MQPWRSYSRRLKSVKNEIYELFPSARRAYYPIRPAVKTKSTPGFLIQPDSNRAELPKQLINTAISDGKVKINYTNKSSSFKQKITAL